MPSTSPSDKKPQTPFVPVDELAESSLLAALLTSAGAFNDVSELLVADDFGHPPYALIYDAIFAVDQAEKPIDAVTVIDELRRRKHLQKAGGPSVILDLAARTDILSNVGAYVDIVRGKSMLRRLLNAGRTIAGEAIAPEAAPDEVLERAEGLIYELGANQAVSSLTAMPQAIAKTLEELAKVRSKALLGHPSGFAELDQLTSGFQGGQLITLAARPGMGKSALAMQLAAHIAQTTGLQVPFLSFEMSTTELVMRLISAQLGYDLHKLRQGDIPPGLDRDLSLTTSAISQMSLFIDDTPPTTVSGVRSAMRRQARRGQIGAIVIDYLQLMEGDRRSKDQNRTQEVSEISRGLKRLASELDVPIIALSQLNRQLETRPNKRPMLADLRESGSIEQDSSLVLFLYRDFVYNPQADPRQAELILAKQRNGPSGISIPLIWDAPAARYLPTGKTYPNSVSPQAIESHSGF